MHIRNSPTKCHRCDQPFDREELNTGLTYHLVGHGGRVYRWHLTCVKLIMLESVIKTKDVDSTMIAATHEEEKSQKSPDATMP